MISNKLELIFIHIPRTGGTSLETALIGMNWWHVDWATKHLTCSQAREIYADYWDRYLKVAIVRNPWDWMVSLYHSHNNIRSAGKRIEWRDYVKSPRLAPHEQNTIIQSEIIGNEMDFILKFEDLGQHFKHLCSRIGIEPLELPHLVTQSGRTGGDYQHYSNYYDDELRDIVAKRHEVDIHRFDYSF